MKHDTDTEAFYRDAHYGYEDDIPEPPDPPESLCFLCGTRLHEDVDTTAIAAELVNARPNLPAWQKQLFLAGESCATCIERQECGWCGKFGTPIAFDNGIELDTGYHDKGVRCSLCIAPKVEPAELTDAPIGWLEPACEIMPRVYPLHVEPMELPEVA